MISSRPGNDLGMRRPSARLVLTLLVTAGCSAGSHAAPGGVDASAGDGGVDASAAPDGGLDGQTDASEDVGANDADAEAGYAVCPETLDATFGSIYAEVLASPGNSCGSVGFGCHSTLGAKTTDNKLDFSLDASAVYAELLGDGGGFPATDIAGDAGGIILRVAPGDAGASMLYVKLTITGFDPRYGDGMPLYSPGSICPPALAAIKQWIDTGAAR